MHNFDDIIAGALDIGQTAAIEARHLNLEPVHLLYGLLQNPRSGTAKNLNTLRSRWMLY